jgi:CspA family cold shock protein
MEAGKVKWFDTRRGFGFIAPNTERKQDVFVHYTDIAGDGYKSLLRGQHVCFEIANGPKGLQAQNVMLMRSWPNRPDPDSAGNLRSAQ